MPILIGVPLCTYDSLDNSCLVEVEFQRKIYFLRVSHISGTPRKCRTPAECYVYSKWYAHILALQRSAMCDKITYRSAGADMSVRLAAIDILIRWSKG